MLSVLRGYCSKVVPCHALAGGLQSTSSSRHHLESLVAFRSALQAVCSPLLFIQDSSFLLLCNLGQLLSGLTQLPLQTGIDALQITEALECAALGSLYQHIELLVELA